MELINECDFCFLMGSAGTPRFHEESDIDIAVFWKNNDSEKNKIKDSLEQKINRDIDLVSLNKIDVIFGRQVLETGRLIFSNSDGVLLNWKAQQLSQYPDFKKSREIIEKNILHRKKYV